MNMHRAYRVPNRHGRHNTHTPIHSSKAETFFLAGLPIVAVALCVIAFVIVPLARVLFS